jgi:DNA polymerase-3 subunit delta'
MHSFLLIGNDEKTIQEKVALLCKQQQVKVIDQKIFTPEKAIGIEDIRLLQEKLSLAPLQSTTKTLIVNNADTMSIAAQNALLKTLEEPPNNTLIILDELL